MDKELTAVKIISQDDNEAVIGGYGVLFGSVDLEGERFTPDTDFMLDLVPVKLAFIDHSMGFEFVKDGKQYRADGIDDPVGEVIKVKPDDTGLYMELLLSKAGEYWDIVSAMLNSGKTGLSTGTIGHLARRSEGVIQRWPIVETSLTLTPAEPRTIGTMARLKTLAEANPEIEAVILKAEGLKAAKDTATADATSDAGMGEQRPQTIIIKETKIMTEEVKEVVDAPEKDVITRDEFGQMGAKIADLGKAVDQLLEFAENQPKLKDAGYIAPDSETDHAGSKSFGDWLIAVRNKNTKRLNEVYGSGKALSEGTGTAGGYLVPTEYEARLMAFAMDNGIVRPRATVLPVMSNNGQVPALDQTAAPTAGVGQSAFAAGVRAYWTAEAGSITSTDPTFELVEWKINKVAGYTKVSNELVADSAIAIESVITRVFGMAITALEDYAFLRGTGAGMPLGVLAAPCAVGVTTTTNDQFGMVDGAKMLAQFQPTPGGSPVWVLHRGLIPDLELYWTATSGQYGDAVQAEKPIPVQLFGYPILYSEHMPAPNTDDALLADFAAYLIFDRQGTQIAYSEENAFLTDEATWRFTKRLDGQPWLSAAITYADPGGAHTVSPFVYHND